MERDRFLALHWIGELAMVTKSESGYSENQITELSQDELDEISGGLVNVSFTLIMAEESSEFVAQETSTGGNSSLSVSGRRRRSLLGFEFSGTFESMDHFSSFFSKFMDFFGRR